MNRARSRLSAAVATPWGRFGQTFRVDAALMCALASCKSRLAAEAPTDARSSTAARSARAPEIVLAKVDPREADATSAPRAPSIATPNYDALIDGARVVMRASRATIVLDYPLSHEARFELLPDGPDDAFTVCGIVRAIAERYAQIYADEQATASAPAEHLPGSLNRAKSDGKYGIWGHDIGDLVLESIRITVTASGDVLIAVGVGS